MCIYLPSRESWELAGVDLSSEMRGTMRSHWPAGQVSNTNKTMLVGYTAIIVPLYERDVCESLYPRLFCSIVWSDWARDNRHRSKTKALHERREGEERLIKRKSGGSHRLLWSALVSPGSHHFSPYWPLSTGLPSHGLTPCYSGN